MSDTRTPTQRRMIMQSVRTKNTGPEMAVRSLLHGLGYRYRLHRKDLPGKPDIVFPGRRKAIFVNGCFWHAHECAKGRAPKSRLEYWGPKLAKNVARDAANAAALRAEGWTILTVWQCELSEMKALEQRLRAFLDEP
ncbi:very short patch repair endonuclease [Variovorax sp. Varisp85]|uniref:very short patch repair endonuclease n=1 Tax=Variovorax sp. Varisp85 TaxID=3243059 RepID=UPI0039A4A881